jgi:hypothetical protein
MVPDQEVFDELHQYVSENYKLVDTFHGTEFYEIFGKNVSFWKNWNTNINSLNYFSDGTISESYFIINRYLNNKNRKEEFL